MQETVLWKICGTKEHPISVGRCDRCSQRTIGVRRESFSYAGEREFNSIDGSSYRRICRFITTEEYRIGLPWIDACPRSVGKFAATVGSDLVPRATRLQTFRGMLKTL